MRTQSPITIGPAGADLEAFRRVRHNGTAWVYAGATDVHDAVTSESIASGGSGTAHTAVDGAAVGVEAAAAIAAGAKVYAAADGKCSSVATGRALGVCTTAAEAAGSIAQYVAPAHASDPGLLASATAASAAVTNTTTPTKFDQQHTLAANALAVGDVLDIEFQGIAPSTNSTDTLNIRLLIGSVEVLAIGAVDVANNDIFKGRMSVVVRAVGASGKIVACGEAVTGAAGTATMRPRFLAETTLDTTAAQTVAVEATWSVANAGNSCRLDVLIVRHLRRAA